MLSPEGNHETQDAVTELATVSAGRKRPASLAGGSPPSSETQVEFGSGHTSAKARAAANAKWKKRKAKQRGAASTSSAWAGTGVHAGPGTKTSVLEQITATTPGSDPDARKAAMAKMKVVDGRVRFHA